MDLFIFEAARRHISSSVREGDRQANKLVGRD